MLFTSSSFYFIGYQTSNAPPEHLSASTASYSSTSSVGTTPVVLARLESDPSAPTIVFYGHYDVEPAGDLDLWNSDPWRLSGSGNGCSICLSLL